MTNFTTAEIAAIKRQKEFDLNIYTKLMTKYTSPIASDEFIMETQGAVINSVKSIIFWQIALIVGKHCQKKIES